MSHPTDLRNELAKFAQAQPHPEVLLFGTDPDDIFLNDAARELFGGDTGIAELRAFLSRFLPNLMFDANETVFSTWGEHFLSFSSLSTNGQRFPLRVAIPHARLPQTIWLLAMLENAHWNDIRLSATHRLLAQLASPALYSIIQGSPRLGSEPEIRGGTDGRPLNPLQLLGPYVKAVMKQSDDYHLVDDVACFLSAWIFEFNVSRNYPNIAFQLNLLPSSPKIPMFTATLSAVLTLVFRNVVSIAERDANVVELSTELNCRGNLRMAIRIRQCNSARFRSNLFFSPHPGPRRQDLPGRDFTWDDLASLLALLGHRAEITERKKDTEISIMFARFPQHPGSSDEAVGRMIRQMPTMITPRGDQLPEIKGLLLEILAQPALVENRAVFDWYQHADGAIAIIVGDVSAYTIAPGILKPLICSSFRDMLTKSTDPADILTSINATLLRCISATGPDLVSATVLIVNPASRSITAATAGATPGCILSSLSGSTPAWTAPPGPPLGVEANPLFKSSAVSLKRGDQLVIMSDAMKDELFRESNLAGQVSHEAIASLADSAETRSGAASSCTMNEDRGFCVRIGFDHARIGSFAIPSAVDFIPQATARILRSADEIGFTNEQMYQIKLAVHEAVVNAIEHGNSRQLNKRVTMRFEVTDDTLIIRISDEGTGFAPGKVPDPTDPENVWREGGRGLFLIRSMMDRVSHEEGGRTIVLEKRRNIAATTQTN